MKKVITFLLITFAVCIGVILAGASTPAYADSAVTSMTISASFGETVISWWQANQSTVVGYITMVIGGALTYITARVKKNNSAIAPLLNDTVGVFQKFFDKFFARFEPGIKKVEALRDEITDIKAKAAETLADARIAAQSVQALLKMTLQVYQSSNVPDYVKALIGQTYADAMKNVSTSTKDIVDASVIQKEMIDAKAKYEVETAAALVKDITPVINPDNYR